MEQSHLASSSQTLKKAKSSQLKYPKKTHQTRAVNVAHTQESRQPNALELDNRMQESYIWFNIIPKRMDQIE